MNALEKLLSAVGLSTERFERMSAAEQANLRTLSDNQAALEQERNTAVSERDAATTRVTELESALATASDLNTELTTQNGLAADTIVAHLATISAHEATIAELNTRLESKPAAADTPIVKGGELMPGQTERKLKSWEVPLYR